MALELLAVAFWTPIGVFGFWILMTGRRLFGLPKWLKEGWQLRVFGLICALMAGYFSYRAVRDGSYAPDGLIGGYTALVIGALVALYRRQKTRRSEAVGPQP
jgi:hypothetical protein